LHNVAEDLFVVGLLDSLEVKGLSLKNRIVMPPMQTQLASVGGAVTDALVHHYVDRSNELGLVIVEHSYVVLSGLLNKKQVSISDDNLIFGLKKLSSSIHAKATPVVIQLNHAGSQADEKITESQPLAPSRSPGCRSLKIDELDSLVESFAMATQRAMKAGFDGVEIHGAHGFLLNQFYSPLTNRRRDRYGGSLENRMRFPLEVIEKVKQQLGRRLLLYRLGAVDLNPRGIKIEDSQKFATKLEDAGVDIIDVSGGLCGSRPDSLQNKQGFFIPQAQQIKKMVNIPVIGVGGIRDLKFANKVIQDGFVDLVAIGRKLLKDSTWVVNALQKLKMT
jgi:2,4-dienoyl-CoA reductase-like NADH-dependent reductase (Old Yellow Enzyme family)